MVRNVCTKIGDFKPAAIPDNATATADGVVWSPSRETEGAVLINFRGELYRVHRKSNPGCRIKITETEPGTVRPVVTVNSTTSIIRVFWVTPRHKIVSASSTFTRYQTPLATHTSNTTIYCLVHINDVITGKADVLISQFSWPAASTAISHTHTKPGQFVCITGGDTLHHKIYWQDTMHPFIIYATGPVCRVPKASNGLTVVVNNKTHRVVVRESGENDTYAPEDARAFFENLKYTVTEESESDGHNNTHVRALNKVHYTLSEKLWYECTWEDGSQGNMSTSARDAVVATYDFPARNPDKVRLAITRASPPDPTTTSTKQSRGARVYTQPLGSTCFVDLRHLLDRRQQCTATVNVLIDNDYRITPKSQEPGLFFFRFTEHMHRARITSSITPKNGFCAMYFDRVTLAPGTSNSRSGRAQDDVNTTRST